MIFISSYMDARLSPTIINIRNTHVDCREMEKKERDRFLKNMRTFLRLCKDEIGLDVLPKIIWVTDDRLRGSTPTFGRFMNHDQVIYVDIMNRHPLDVMRTLAHELTHYKQWLDGRLHPGSGETGSEQENQAHAVAGIVMRHFDRANPDAFDSEPID